MADRTLSNGRRAIRAKLRHATFIDPQTGIRSKRSFTLHNSEYGNSTRDPSPSPPSSDQEPPPLPQTRWIRVKTSIKQKALAVRAFMVSDLGKGIFKCAVTYLIASMCTFIPFFSTLLGKYDSKHTAATVAVYFHPARSVGNMIEALILALAAFSYAALVSVSSMAVSVFFIDVLHQVVIGHTVVLIIFVGGGLGMVGWIKLKRGDPLVNVACSLTSLSLIAILTSEGAVQAGDLSFDNIGQYFRMTLAGVVSAMVVCFVLFPVYAQNQFKKNIVDVTDSLSDMLGMITSSFISGDEMELESKQYAALSEGHRKTSTNLTQNLKEAKFELNLVGLEAEARIHAKMVQCVQRIATSIGGLRSAAAMQFVVVHQTHPTTSHSNTSYLQSYASIMTSPTRSPSLERSSARGFDFDTALRSIAENDVENMNGTGTVRRQSSKFRSPQQIFELFIEHLGPSMRSLAFTMKEILDDLPFDAEANYAVTNNPRFRTSLERALTLYKEARNVALETVYDKKNMDRSRPLEVEADWEEAAACCGHFSFCLLEVAEQIKEYLVTLDDLEAEVDDRPEGRSWSWLRFWKRSDGSEEDSTVKDNHSSPNLERHLAQDYHLNNEEPRFKNKINNPFMQADVSRSRYKERFFRKIYNALSFLRREDKKYAIKVGLGAVLYALPSFVAATRPIYSHWRGEWGLLSYMLVCSMTIGAANTTGYQRFIGTCLGAGLSVVAWKISNENPIPLAIFGFCMAYWTAYIIVGKGKGPMGRFIMLSYNLSALYAYNLLMTHESDDSDEEDGSQNPMIYTIALHRCVAVLSGCVWGIIITRVVWPISARQKLKDGLSLLWLRMGLVWKRDPLSIFTDDGSPDRQNTLLDEAELQQFLGKVRSLLNASKNEFELRRPFPDIAYTRILRSTAKMLDAFHTMSIVVAKDLTASRGEVALLQATANERAQLCSRISHQFSVLASSVKLEYSIANDAMPNTEHTRDRLLAKIFAYRKLDAQARNTHDEDYSLLYTYALVTGQIGMEIQECLKEIEALFGILDEESLWLQ